MNETAMVLLVCFIGWVVACLIRVFDAKQRHKADFTYKGFWKRNDVIVVLNFFINMLYAIIFLYRGVTCDRDLIMLFMLATGGYFFYDKIFKMISRKFFPNFEKKKFEP